MARYEKIIRDFANDMGRRAAQFEPRGTPRNVDERADAAEQFAALLTWVVPAARDMLIELVLEADAEVGAMSPVDLKCLSMTLDEAMTDWMADTHCQFDDFAQGVADKAIVDEPPSVAA